VAKNRCALKALKYLGLDDCYENFALDSKPKVIVEEDLDFIQFLNKEE